MWFTINPGPVMKAIDNLLEHGKDNRGLRHYFLFHAGVVMQNGKRRVRLYMTKKVLQIMTHENASASELALGSLCLAANSDIGRFKSPAIRVLAGVVRKALRSTFMRTYIATLQRTVSIIGVSSVISVISATRCHQLVSLGGACGPSCKALAIRHNCRNLTTKGFFFRWSLAPLLVAGPSMLWRRSFRWPRKLLRKRFCKSLGCGDPVSL